MRMRELCEMRKMVDERSDDNVLRWFEHIERMGNDKIAKRVYIGKRYGNSFGRLTGMTTQKK